MEWHVDHNHLITADPHVCVYNLAVQQHSVTAAHHTCFFFPCTPYALQCTYTCMHVHTHTHIYKHSSPHTMHTGQTGSVGTPPTGHITLLHHHHQTPPAAQPHTYTCHLCTLSHPSTCLHILPLLLLLDAFLHGRHNLAELLFRGRRPLVRGSRGGPCVHPGNPLPDAATRKHHPWAVDAHDSQGDYTTIGSIDVL